MQVRQPILFAPKLFEIPQQASVADIELSFPTPSCIERMPVFLAENTQTSIDFRAGIKCYLEIIRAKAVLFWPNAVDANLLNEMKAKIQTIQGRFSFTGVNEENNRHLYKLYTHGVRALHCICNDLQSSTVTEDLKKNALKNMLRSVDVCTDGIFLNIMDCYKELRQEVSDQFRLVRERLAVQAILEIFRKNAFFDNLLRQPGYEQFVKNNEIHFARSIINASAESLHILTEVDENMLDLTQPYICDPQNPYALLFADIYKELKKIWHRDVIPNISAWVHGEQVLSYLINYRMDPLAFFSEVTCDNFLERSQAYIEHCKQLGADDAEFFTVDTLITYDHEENRFCWKELFEYQAYLKVSLLQRLHLGNYLQFPPLVIVLNDSLSLCYFNHDFHNAYILKKSRGITARIPFFLYFRDEENIANSEFRLIPDKWIKSLFDQIIESNVIPYIPFMHQQVLADPLIENFMDNTLFWQYCLSQSLCHADPLKGEYHPTRLHSLGLSFYENVKKTQIASWWSAFFEKQAAESLFEFLMAGRGKPYEYMTHTGALLAFFPNTVFWKKIANILGSPLFLKLIQQPYHVECIVGKLKNPALLTFFLKFYSDDYLNTALASRNSLCVSLLQRALENITDDAILNSLLDRLTVKNLYQFFAQELSIGYYLMSTLWLTCSVQVIRRCYYVAPLIFQEFVKDEADCVNKIIEAKGHSTEIMRLLLSVVAASQMSLTEFLKSGEHSKSHFYYFVKNLKDRQLLKEILGALQPGDIEAEFMPLGLNTPPRDDLFTSLIISSDFLELFIEQVEIEIILKIIEKNHYYTVLFYKLMLEGKKNQQKMRAKPLLYLPFIVDKRISDKASIFTGPLVVPLTHFILTLNPKELSALFFPQGSNGVIFFEYIFSLEGYRDLINQLVNALNDKNVDECFLKARPDKMNSFLRYIAGDYEIFLSFLKKLSIASLHHITVDKRLEQDLNPIMLRLSGDRGFIEAMLLKIETNPWDAVKMYDLDYLFLRHNALCLGRTSILKKIKIIQYYINEPQFAVIFSAPGFITFLERNLALPLNEIKYPCKWLNLMVRILKESVPHINTFNGYLAQCFLAVQHHEPTLNIPDNILTLRDLSSVHPQVNYAVGQYLHQHHQKPVLVLKCFLYASNKGLAKATQAINKIKGDKTFFTIFLEQARKMLDQYLQTPLWFFQRSHPQTLRKINNDLSHLGHGEVADFMCIYEEVKTYIHKGDRCNVEIKEILKDIQMGLEGLLKEKCGNVAALSRDLPPDALALRA